MQRRGFVKALVAAPAAPLFAGQAQRQQPAGQPAPGIPTNPTQGVPPPVATAEDTKLEVSIPDSTSDPKPKFFSALQLAALRKLCELMMPAMHGGPGAEAVGAPEFLDFLISESPAERQHLYRAGLDGLNASAKKHFNTGFGELEAKQADTLLGPLREPWTAEPPADPVARFLRQAKLDIRTATMNTREYTASSPQSGRRFGGNGLYWYPLD